MELTHFNEQGRARMVDVSEKAQTYRVARAAATARQLPPKVEPWSPGWNASAAKPRAAHMPMGKPSAIPLAMVATSGTMP